MTCRQCAVFGLALCLGAGGLGVIEAKACRQHNGDLLMSRAAVAAPALCPDIVSIVSQLFTARLASVNRLFACLHVSRLPWLSLMLVFTIAPIRVNAGRLRS